MKKQIFTFLTVTLLSTSLLVVPAKANNYQDTDFYFSFPSSQSGYDLPETGPRIKEDTSSAYMRCTDSSARYYEAWVVGVYDGREFDASVNPNDSNDVRHYVFYGDGEYQYMHNWVKETANANGWSTVYAKIRAQKYNKNDETFAAGGVWSPDNC